MIRLYFAVNIFACVDLLFFFVGLFGLGFACYTVKTSGCFNYRVVTMVADKLETQ